MVEHKNAEVTDRRPNSILILPPGQTLADVSDKDMLPQDLVGVQQALVDHEKYGRYRIEPLRTKTPDGRTLWKMRLNGHKNKGIRVRCVYVGNNRYMIEKVKYIGKAYEDI